MAFDEKEKTKKERVHAYVEGMKESQECYEKQIGGNHYKDSAIQPIEYIQANKLGFEEGCVVKYISRYRSKNGLEDLRKAKQYLEFIAMNIYKEKL